MSEKNIMHLDTIETAFFKRQLEYVKSKTYDTKYQNLNGLRLMPISSEAGAGADFIIWYSFSQAGLAKIISDYAKDFPRVDVYASENQSKVYSLGSSYGYSIKDVRRAQMAGNNLDTRRANAARRSIDELIDKMIWFGDSDYNIPGFIAYPGITEFTVPATGTGSTKTWSTKTPDQIITDLSGILSAVTVPTKGREVPNTILIPRAQFNLIKDTRMTDGDSETILTFFKKTNPGVMVEALDELDGQGTGATDRYMAFVRDPEHVTVEMPQMFEQMEPDKEGMEYNIPCHAEYGGLLVYYTAAIAFGDGI